MSEKKSSKHTPQRPNNGPQKLDLEELWDMPPWEWPKNTELALLRLLQDREAPEEDRRTAVYLIGALCGNFEKPFRACLKILTCPAEPESLRCAAAIALGPSLEQMDCLSGPELEDPDFAEEPWIPQALFLEAKTTLYDLWQSPEVPKTVKRKILEASVRSPQAWHSKAIRTAYSADDTEWKLSAVFAMQYVRGFETEILEALEHPDPDIHCEAVRAAGEWCLNKAWPHVRSILRKAPKDKNLLLAAIEAAPGLSPSEAGELISPYLDSKDEDIAETAMEAVPLLDMEEDEEEWEDHFFNEDDEEDDPEPPQRNVIPLSRKR